MKISLLIPAFNEELTVGTCIESVLAQSRLPDEIIVVDDGSTDHTASVLAKFGNKIRAVATPRNTGAKSKAQEYGISFVTGDILIMTDADTILSKDFVKNIEEDFSDPNIHAVAGYVQSLQHNWLTACRELDYLIGQDIHKRAQSNIGAIMVIPGCGAGFRVETLREYITFDHDTLTEDLDFTYKLHKKDFIIHYDKRAVVYTQDPETLNAYINQMRRWIGGGWENLVKHFDVVKKRQGHALEIGLIYSEGMMFGLLFFVLPIINVRYFFYFLSGYFSVAFLFGIYGSIRRRRYDLIMYAPFFPFILVINSVIFFEQFIKKVLLRKKDMEWFKPTRRSIS